MRAIIIALALLTPACSSGGFYRKAPLERPEEVSLRIDRSEYHRIMTTVVNINDSTFIMVDYYHEHAFDRTLVDTFDMNGWPMQSWVKINPITCFMGKPHSGDFSSSTRDCRVFDILWENGEEAFRKFMEAQSIPLEHVQTRNSRQ